MNEFGTVLKEARISAKKKLREVADHIKLSISYISDIEQGRKHPPDLETVYKLQEFLLVKNNKLITIATTEKTKRPTEVVQKIQNRDGLRQLFFRTKDFSDEQLIELLNQVDKIDNG